jgi:pimeloyl-ACP methyl ester carboxylesterase
VSGGPVECELAPGDPDRRPLVFLHEGLGSIDLWRGLPRDVAASTDHPSTLVYARHGYGASGAAIMPRPTNYMHREAEVVLPEVLGSFGLERPILIGHSDGASIALLYAASGAAVAGLVCIAPHVFVEPESIAGIEAARDSFDQSDMAERMARYHADPVATFRGWNDVWLSDDFRTWNIESVLPSVVAPVLLVQGTDDQYGTTAQLDAIGRGISGPVERVVVEGAGHSPHLDARAVVVGAITTFVRGLRTE